MILLQVIIILLLLYTLYFLFIGIFYSKNKISKIVRSYYNTLDYSKYNLNTTGNLRNTFMTDFYENSLFLTGLEENTYEINKNGIFTYNFKTSDIDDLNQVLGLFLYIRLSKKFNLENIVLDPIERRSIEQEEIRERILKNYKESSYIYGNFLATKIKNGLELEYLEEVYGINSK